MKKYFPYLLIGLAFIGGIFVAKDMGLYSNSEIQKAPQTEVKDQKNNRIDNRFKSLLIYPKKNPLKAFSLVNQDQQTFSNNDFKGYWNLIFSGYTNCPDVCPNTLNQMVRLYKIMPEEVKSKIQFIFLTVDPERDTAEHLKAYLDYFDESFVGLTGDISQIDRLIRSLGGIYSLNKEEGEFYSVDHSARIFIVNPKAQRFGIIDSQAFKQPDQSQILADLTALITD